MRNCDIGKAGARIISGDRSDTSPERKFFARRSPSLRRLISTRAVFDRRKRLNATVPSVLGAGVGETEYQWHPPRLQRHLRSFAQAETLGAVRLGSSACRSPSTALLLLGTPRQPVPARPIQASFEPAPPALRATVRVARRTRRSRRPTDVEIPPTVVPAEPPGIIFDLLVKRGDTLEVLFRRNGLSLTDLAAMVALPDASAALKLLKPGDRLEISHRDGQVLSLRRELDDIKVLSIARDESGFAANTIEREVDIRTTGAHGEIQSSLFEAGTAAGISDRTTMDMAGIFEWDIDFIQDVREGDTFTVIYEELWRDGVKLRDGQIVAAEFVNQGKSFRAARFRDASGRAGYYTPEGRSVRKAFIRAPSELHAYQLELQPEPAPPGAEHHPRASRRRLRRSDGHADPRCRRRQGVVPRRPGRIRQHDHPAARRQHHDLVRSPVAVRQRARRRARESGRRHRLRRAAAASPPARTCTTSTESTACTAIRAPFPCRPPTRFARGAANRVPRRDGAACGASSTAIVATRRRPRQTCQRSRRTATEPAALAPN